MSNEERMISDLIDQENRRRPGRVKSELEERGCPDGGACHHLCADRCWRVSTCLPLGGKYDAGWPELVRRAHSEDALILGTGVLHEPPGERTGGAGQIARHGTIWLIAPDGGPADFRIAPEGRHGQLIAEIIEDGPRTRTVLLGTGDFFLSSWQGTNHSAGVRPPGDADSSVWPWMDPEALDVVREARVRLVFFEVPRP